MHYFYSDQLSVCPTCWNVALTESPKVQTVHRTITIATKRKSEIPVALLSNNKHHSSNGKPHNWYSVQQSVWTSCCTIALTVSPTVQTVHRTIALATKVILHYLFHTCTKNKTLSTDGSPIFILRPKIILPYPLDFYTYSEPHSTDGTPHNCSSDQEWVCISYCPVALI